MMQADVNQMTLPAVLKGLIDKQTRRKNYRIYGVKEQSLTGTLQNCNL